MQKYISSKEKAKILVEKYGLEEALSMIDIALKEMSKQNKVKTYHLKVREEIKNIKNIT